MNTLLDTCAVLALARGELPRAAAGALRTATEAWVSAVTPWEVAIKARAGKLRLKIPVDGWFVELAEHYDLRVEPIDVRTACAAATLPPVHGDPFGRVVVALAFAHQLTILTSDERIAAYPGVRTVW